MLTVKYSKQAIKFLKKGDQKTAKRILRKIEGLQEDPFPKDTKRVEGYKEKTFRVRVGHLRILSELDQQNNLLGIIKIDKRPNVY